MNFLGIDIGSTAVKACVIGTDGKKILSRGSADYPTLRPTPECAVQDPEDWNRAAVRAVRQAVDALSDSDRAAVSGICLSAQAGSVYAADADKHPLCGALTWMDRRAADEHAEVIRDLDAASIRQKCGWKPSPSDCIAKVLWLKRHRPDVSEKAAYYYTTEESVTGFMTGNFVTDATGNVLTRFYDYAAGDYIPEVLDYLGITRENLPEVLPCSSFAGRLLPDAAKAMGLNDGIPVYVGAHDQYCASVGSGVTEPGQLLIATGTAWVLFGVSEAPIAVPPFPAACTHPVSGRFGVMSSMAGCGGALGAFAERCGTTPYELDCRILEAGIEKKRNELRGYFVCPLPPEPPLPHKEGVCVPLAVPEGRDPADVALCAMEAVAFEARALVEAFESAGFAKGGDLVISGGASKSPLWREIVAAAFPHRQLYRLCEADAPALGAAILAAYGAGVYPTLAEACTGYSDRIAVPLSAPAAAFYEKKYAAYSEWAFEK